MPAPELSWIAYEVVEEGARPLAAGADADVAAAVELPDLRAWPSAAEKARILLESAAEVEHALMVQYLYAAYSLKTPDEVTEADQRDVLDERTEGAWPLVLLDVAREEMGHLLTVQNLLLLLGLPPNLEREDFPPRKDLYPFALHLERLSQRSLAKYVVAESPADATGIDDVVALARESAGATINRVGVLYGLLGLVFGRGAADPPSGDEAWDAVVRRLAAAAYEQSPPPTWHLPDDAFHPESAERQGAPDDWQVSGLRVHRVADRAAAIGAIRDVGEQGEGPTTEGASHYARFLAVFRGDPNVPLVAMPPEGGWVPTREVPTDPRPETFTDARTRAWAELADLRYGLLLGFVEDLLLSDAERRPQLVAWIFAEMRSRLAPIARRLTTMPRGDGAGVAGVPFTLPADLHLPADEAARRAVHAARTREAIAKVEELRAGAPADRDDPFLAELLAADRARLAQLEAPRPGTSFVRDLQPLFRPKDVDHMRRRRLDLAAYEAVKANAAQILARVRMVGGPRQMPPWPDQPWTPAQADLLERWMADGFPE